MRGSGLREKNGLLSADEVEDVLGLSYRKTGTRKERNDFSKSRVNKQLLRFDIENGIINKNRKLLNW